MIELSFCVGIAGGGAGGVASAASVLSNVCGLYDVGTVLDTIGIAIGVHSLLLNKYRFFYLSRLVLLKYPYSCISSASIL